MLIHIGYHKTGTSWLQARIFQPYYGYTQMASHAEVDQMIVRPHGLTFDPDAVRAEFASRQLRRPAAQAPVISSEILSGHPFFGGIGSDILAERLARIFPSARILITIRSQNAMLPSVYMQYLQRGGTLPAPSFFSGTTAPGYQGFAREHFEYHRLIGHYKSLFENVLVLPLESLSATPTKALNTIREFAQCLGPDWYLPEDLTPRSVSAPEWSSGAIRRLNHLRRSTLNPAPIFPVTSEQGRLYRSVIHLARATHKTGRLKWRPVKSYVEREIAPRYAASNQFLRGITGNRLDLSDYPQTASSPCFQGSALTTAAGPVSVL